MSEVGKSELNKIKFILLVQSIVIILLVFTVLFNPGQITGRFTVDPDDPSANPSRMGHSGAEIEVETASGDIKKLSEAIKEDFCHGNDEINCPPPDVVATKVIVDVYELTLDGNSKSIHTAAVECSGGAAPTGSCCHSAMSWYCRQHGLGEYARIWKGTGGGWCTGNGANTKYTIHCLDFKGAP